MKKGALLFVLLMSVFIPVSFGNIGQHIKSTNVGNIYQTALNYYDKEKYSQAIKLCNRAISVYSQDEKIHVLKIQALTNANKIKERNKAVQIAVQMFPESADINFYRGQIYYENKDYENAVKYLTKSIEINPTPRAYHTLGLSYSELNNFAEALYCFNREVEVTPILKNREILSQAEILLKADEPQKAYDLAHEVSKSEPLYYASYKIKAIASANMLDYDIYR